MLPNSIFMRPVNDADSESKAHELGQQAKKDGKHPIQDNPYCIRQQGDRWEHWLNGWQGKPFQHHHHQD